MHFKSFFSFVILAVFGSTVFAQADLQITKKISRTIPGMEQISMASLPPEAAKHMKELNNPVATVYIKGSSMRTDTTVKAPKMTSVGYETHTFSTVIQCGQQKLTNFDTKSKKYYEYSMREKSPAEQRNSRIGGYIAVTGKVIDTGEKAKLFGFDARRFKQTFIFTPGPNACQKQKFQVEIDGWYADIPGFSCPLRAALPENTAGGDCVDDLDYQIEGSVRGVALKEVKKISMDGQTVTMDEEATGLKKVDLLDSIFEPPVGYKPGKTISKSANSSGTNISSQYESTNPGTNSSSSLALPVAGLVEQLPPAKKNAGVLRIGIAKPKITTPETKKDANAGSDIADAVSLALLAGLKADKIEAVRLETDSPENECKQKECDYIFYADVTQKRGGGGMFGKMLAMGAMSAVGGLIPGVGGMVAATAGNVLMGQTMGKAAKAKDEFTFAYKVTELNSAAILTQALSKSKAKEDGEDVLTPQIKQASAAVLTEIAKKTIR